MASSDFRSSASLPAFIALGCVGFISTAPAMAQSETQGGKLGGVTVEATAIEEEVKVERVESPKATAPLLDTPQTITVISDQTLRKQNLLTLRDALQTIPGITFGAGEGGGGYGDSINLRGYSANNDITQDGVRDSAQYSRTETFNLQQIEVYNGANTVFNGSGSVGGTINLVTKTPQADDLTILSAGIGTDDYYRATVDSNLRVSDLVAFRLNGVYHRNDYPGRDVERYKRWGIAPSVTIGMDGPTRFTLSYVHQKDDNIPVYGVPFFASPTNKGPLPGVSDSDYFGIANLDDQDIRLDQATARIDHDFSDKVSIRNLTRFQRVKQDSVTSAPQGVYCLPGGVQPTTGANGQPNACPATQNVPGTYYPSGPRGLVRNQTNDLFYNQTDLKAVFNTGGLEHNFVIGASFSKEDYKLTTGNLLRKATGEAEPQSPIDIYNPDTTYAGAVNLIVSGKSYGTNESKAIYAFDTIKLGQHFELNAGARYENYKGTFRADTFSTAVATLGDYKRGDDQKNSEDLFSYRVGLNYKPVETVSVYAAYANSRTPRSATVRLGCGPIIDAPGGAVDPCDVGAEKAFNYEVGVKADLFDRRLQLTGAVFRNDRTNFSVPTNDPVVGSLPVLDGKSRVDGIALGATGNITEAWSIFANYTYLDSKVRQGVSDACLANPGQNNCTNSVANPDPQAGDNLVQTPKHSGSLFTTYTLPFGLQLGYGFTYQGSFGLNQSSVLNGVQYRSDDYLIHRAMLSYPFDNGMTLQLNVQNFTDENYYTGIRSNVNGTTGAVTGGWATPGEGRSARLSLFYSF
ncbi:catecholate siderophore receptor [Sphingomonas laterariae]|uniref:Catecholate siderophore receptor n=1 Tax=Edaphosphingomonas laterariae TaxID=861865 RepID=A0A239EGS1_9SPHN|nr:TonB-dependent receptor [Sphingomonas laterariae]SNS43084.1 catecholate siderophore receptor [Sphingomonas laterariae]